jgi:Fur family transcriptional regulator, peroxide stress response regulator
MIMNNGHSLFYPLMSRGIGTGGSYEKTLTDRNSYYIITNMNKQEKSLDIFKAKCRENNLRITPQRIAIYEIVKDDYSHPSADDVYKKIKGEFSNISFDTVNRTLLSFVDSGILKLAESYGRRKRFDSDIGSHHHLSCIKCGKIIDFIDKDFDGLKIPGSIENKYTVLGKRVVLEYICDKCSGKKYGGRK